MAHVRSAVGNLQGKIRVSVGVGVGGDGDIQIKVHNVHTMYGGHSTNDVQYIHTYSMCMYICSYICTCVCMYGYCWCGVSGLVYS